jgi:hypothetical protein
MHDTTKARPAFAAVAASAAGMGVNAPSSAVETPAPTSAPAIIVPIAGPTAAARVTLNWGHRSTSRLENPSAKHLAPPDGGQAIAAAESVHVAPALAAILSGLDHSVVRTTVSAKHGRMA